MPPFTTVNHHLQALSQDVCFYEQSQCDQGLTGWIFIFGGLQLFLSQLPNFHGLWWVSMLGAATSCIYTSIAAFASAAYIGAPEMDCGLYAWMYLLLEDTFIKSANNKLR